MDEKKNDLVEIVAWHAGFPVGSGLWLSYVGGFAPWIGGVAGLGLTLVLGAGALLRRRFPRPERDRLAKLLES